MSAPHPGELPDSGTARWRGGRTLEAHGPGTCRSPKRTQRVDRARAQRQPTRRTHRDGGPVTGVAQSAARVCAWLGNTSRPGTTPHWHLDRHCPRLIGRPRKSGVVASVCAVASVESAYHRAPCMACALTGVLEAVGGTQHGPGHHAVICQTYHGNAGGGACASCTLLTRYDAARAGGLSALVGAGLVRGARVAVLLPGALESSSWHLYQAALDGHSAPNVRPPDVDVPTWRTAAELLIAGGERTTLDEALQIAGGVHARVQPAPAGGSTEGQTPPPAGASGAPRQVHDPRAGGRARRPAAPRVPGGHGGVLTQLQRSRAQEVEDVTFR